MVSREVYSYPPAYNHLRASALETSLQHESLQDRVPIARLHRATSKVKHRRLRTGCLTCKKRRLKCDESKPACLQCRRTHLECEGTFYASNRSRNGIMIAPAVSSSSGDATTPSCESPPVENNTPSSDSAWSNPEEDNSLLVMDDTLSPFSETIGVFDLMAPATTTTTPPPPPPSQHPVPTMMTPLRYTLQGRELDNYLSRVFFERLCSEMIHTMLPGPLNPVNDALRPLTQSSTTVGRCVHALSSLYLAALYPESHSLSEALQLKGQAIALLARDVSEVRHSRSDSILAATLLLYMCEEMSQRWDQSSKDHLTYLNGARRLIQHRFFDLEPVGGSLSSSPSAVVLPPHRHTSATKHRDETEETSDTWITRVLVKVFIWNDMFTTLSLPFSEYAASFTLQALRLTDVLNRKDDLNPFLFGWARDIFWLMSDVMSFAQQLYRTLDDSRSSSTQTTATASVAVRVQMLGRASRLERSLQTYAASSGRSKLYMGFHRPSDSHLDDCSITVECYRRAALLYLYQLMPVMASDDAMEELATSILDLELSVSPSSPSVAFHLWILVVAGSQMKPVEEVEEGIELDYRFAVLRRLEMLESIHPCTGTCKAKHIMMEVGACPSLPV